MKLEIYLREEKQKRKLTIADFARSVGVGRAQVWRWIHTDVTPRPAQIERIEVITGGQVTWRDLLAKYLPQPASRQPPTAAVRHADLPLSDQVMKCRSR